MELVLTGILLVGLPLGLAIFLRTNSGAMFLAGCSGLVLLYSLDPVVVSTAGSFLPTEGEAYIRLLVVLLAIVFAGIIFRHTTHGPVVIAHAFLAILLGCLLWLALPESVGLSWLTESTKEDAWIDASQFQSLVVALGLSLSLVLLHHKTPRHHKKHH